MSILVTVVFLLIFFFISFAYLLPPCFLGLLLVLLFLVVILHLQMRILASFFVLPQWQKIKKKKKKNFDFSKADHKLTLGFLTLFFSQLFYGEIYQPVDSFRLEEILGLYAEPLVSPDDLYQANLRSG